MSNIDNYRQAYETITTEIESISLLEGDHSETINILLLKQQELTVEFGNVEQVNDLSVEIFQQDTVETDIQDYLNNTNVYGCITANTQVGKTKATIQLVEFALRLHSLVIISTDNHLDQQTQMYNRVDIHFATSDVVLLKVSDNSFAMDFGNALKNKKRCIVFVLDNASQINKLIDPMARHARRADHIKNIVLISDEGDTITKDVHINDEDSTTAVSQKLWIELELIVANSYLNIAFKRLFVTATVANICKFYGIKKLDLIQLLPPPSYSGHHDIKYYEIEDTLDIPRVLLTEAIRIYEGETSEAIIVNSERMIASQENLVASIAEYCRCATIHTYNGSDMVVYTTSSGLIEELTSLKTTTVKTNRRGVTTIKTTDVSYRIDGNTIIIKNCKMVVADFYSLCKKYGERVVITIGKDLVTRAVSFVSRCEDNQLCATTMIYLPSKTMHSTGHIQTIGRITGCVQKGLQRRLYAPKAVIEDYRNTLQNQDAFISKLKSAGNERDTTELWNEFIPPHTISTSIDRIKLEMGKSFGLGVPDTRDVAAYDSGTVRRTITNWMRESNHNINAEVFRLFLFSDEVTKSTIENKLVELGSVNINEYVLQLTKVDDRKCYHHIFKKFGSIYKLTDGARKLLEELNV
jgi:hypothetical protein